jgi:hypothetical protein
VITIFNSKIEDLNKAEKSIYIMLMAEEIVLMKIMVL